ncbi:MAG: creatininase family protein [Synechococcus sp.]
MTGLDAIPHCKNSTPKAMRRLEHLWWPALQAAAQQPGSTVVLPVGAFEQHGPHLPMGTDLLFAEAVVDRVLDRLPAELPLWRLPAVAFGFSPEHLGFPGTVSLSAEALLAQLQGIAAALSEAGFRRLVLFNGHGGQIALLQVAARQLQQQFPSLAVLPWFLWSGPPGVLEQIPEPERSQGLHAGRLETSLMLALHPELVGELPAGEAMASPPAGLSLEGAVPTAWRTRSLSNSGVVGDPAGASAAEGELLLQGLVGGWCELFDTLLRSDWPHMRPVVGTMQRQ